jgi:AcrR family transcriptional regulator
MAEQLTKREIRQQEILTAATAFFAQKGFNGASMDDIFHASGLSKGGLYWHFKSKDDIIAAILNQFFSEEMALLDALLKMPGSASERLQLLGQQTASEVGQMQDILSISLEFYALAARRKDVRATLQEYFERYSCSLATLIQAGIDDGEFDAGITPEHVAFNLVAQFEGLVLLWAMQAGDFDLAQQTTTAVTHLIQGLQKK